MKFGDEIRMLRDYDAGRYAEGAVYQVGIGEPEEEYVRPNVAESLCREAVDGDGAFAKKVTTDDSTTEG